MWSVQVEPKVSASHDVTRAQSKLHSEWVQLHGPLLKLLFSVYERVLHVSGD